MNREIETVIAPQRVIDDGDMLLYRALPQLHRESVGPFVMDSEERIAQAYEDYRNGEMGTL